MPLRSWLTAALRPRRAPSIDWNEHHRSGLKEFLGDLEEIARYWVLTGYCASRFAHPDVLDVGCGAGILEEKLRRIPYRTYTGLDISEEALDRARVALPASCRLVRADMMTFDPAEQYDAIVFNESVIPGMPVVEIVARYSRHLRPGGRVLFSLFDGRDRRNTIPVWDELTRHFTVEDSVRVENLPARKSWTVAMLDPGVR